MFYEKAVLKEFGNIHRKMLVLECLFNKVEILKIEMIFLEKFDYQKFYISNKIDELAEVCTSRF